MKLKDKIRFWLLFSPVLGKILIKRNLDSLLQYKFRYEGTIGEVIDANITQYSRCDSLTKDERNSLTIDIVQCYYRYRAHPKEYFMFGFPGMSTKRRKQFLTQRYKDFVMTKYVGLGDKRMFLEDKWRFYNFFHEYFKKGCHMSKVGR